MIVCGGQPNSVWDLWGSIKHTGFHRLYSWVEIDAANLKIVPAASYLTVLAGLSEKPVIEMDGLAKRAFGSGADTSLDGAFKKL